MVYKILKARVSIFVLLILNVFTIFAKPGPAVAPTVVNVTIISSGTTTATVGANIKVTGTAILTINGDLYDALGTFTIAPGAKVILKGNIRNNQGTVKVVNTSTNGMEIKGNVHVPQGSDG